MNGAFENELEHLINRCSIENESNTPDFILAEYLRGCLDLWNNTTKKREKWYGKELKIGMDEGEPISPPSRPITYKVFSKEVIDNAIVKDGTIFIMDNGTFVVKNGALVELAKEKPSRNGR